MEETFFLNVCDDGTTFDFLERLNFLLNVEEKTKAIFLRNFILAMRYETTKIKKITLEKTGDPLIDNIMLE